ncbi:MAG TPA: hypothetical protein VFS92_00900 [Planctomycetota bacterium]|nr:hypothetical protein [Planctomycetota bacterium]
MVLRSLIVAVAIAASASAASAQIVVENAGTVSPETPILQSRFETARWDDGSEVRLTESYFWAPRPRLDFGLSVPLVRRELDSPFGPDAEYGGIGDISFRVKNTFHQADGVMRSTRFGGLAGVQLPTGSWHEEEEGVDVPRDLQVGTGTLGFYGGALFTHIADRHRFAGEVIGQIHTERDDFQPGSSLRLGGSYWYRISPSIVEVAGARTEFRGVVELTHVYFADGRVNGDRVGDGGTETTLSLGVQVYPTTSVLFEAAVQVPLHETTRDSRGDRGVGGLLTLKILF